LTENIVTFLKTMLTFLNGGKKVVRDRRKFRLKPR